MIVVEMPGSVRFEAAPVRSPTRPPNGSILWVAGWGSGPVPHCAVRRNKTYFTNGSIGLIVPSGL